MSTINSYWKLLLLILMMSGYFHVSAQVNSVNNYLQKVNSNVDQINQLAKNKQVYEAVDLLNETRRDLDNYVNRYLEDEMRKAKAENPSFGPFLNVQFDPILTAAYWEERVQRSQKSIRLAKEAMADGHHNRTLDSQDEVWSYLKTVYGVGKMFKDVADNVSTGQFYDAIKSAKEGVDGFIEDYKGIEEARLQIINTELYEVQVNGVIKRGERMEEKCWKFASFMRIYEQDVNEFYQIVARLNQKIEQISNEAEIDWSSATYNWNGQKYLNQIKTLASNFKTNGGDYYAVKEKIEAINEQAENDKIHIFQNIQNSGANNAFEKGNQLEEEFNEFYDLSFDVIDECYAFDKNRVKESTPNNTEPITTSAESYSYITNPKAFFNRIHSIGNQLLEGDISEEEYEQECDAVTDDLIETKLLMLGASKTNESHPAIEKEYHDFTVILNIERDKYRNRKPISNPLTISSSNQAEPSGSFHTETTANEYTGSSNQQTVSSPAEVPGQRLPNKLYHGWWSWDMNNRKIKLKQNGNSVEIGQSGEGTIRGGSMVFNSTEEDGTSGTDTYTLIGDGYKIKVRKEWTTERIKDKIKMSMSAPTPEKIQEFRNKNGKYLEFTMVYAGNSMAMFNDLDSDQVPDDSDNCPDTPAGLTVQNGGVDISGCPTGQGQAVASNTVSQPANNSVSNQNKQAASTPSSQAANLFAGSTTKKTTAPKTNNTPSQAKTASTAPINTSLKPDKVSSAVNKMPKTGASQWARIPVYHLKENEKLVFKQTGGTFLKFRARWVGKNFSEVLFEETKQIVYLTTELMEKRPQQAMYIDFRVNEYSDTYGYMEAWVFPKGVPIPAEWNIKESNGGGNGNGTGGNGFYDLIAQADEAFDKKYWEQNQNTTGTVSNPKQESLSILKKCEPIISSENSIQEKYSMVKILSAKYAEYAKRVHIYSAKDHFVSSAGTLLSRYGNEVGRINDRTQKIDAYKIIAEAWRDLTKAAKWEGGNYNKNYCDKESKRYYQLALNEDQNNTQLQKTIEKINAPKRPIPAQVASTPAIHEEKWAKVETVRSAIVNNPGEYAIQDEQINALPVGNMANLDIGSGDVWIMRSGTNNWLELSENVEIFTGDKIKTGPNVQNVSFTYLDCAQLNLKHSSIITFNNDYLYIERGNAHIQVRKDGDKFFVLTPSTATGLRGTEFSIAVNNSGETDLHLYEGAIELRNSTQISYLIPGETARIINDYEPIKTQTFDIHTHKQQNWNKAALQSSTPSNLFIHVTSGGNVVGGR